jgi:hypothetical protein
MNRTTLTDLLNHEADAADGFLSLEERLDRALAARGTPDSAPSIPVTVELDGLSYSERILAGRGIDTTLPASERINPKDAAAATRVPMHLFPSVGAIYGAMACRDGAIKYGPYNWRERKISLVTYIGAMKRHLDSLLDGEDDADDSKLPHLAHVVATAAILLDAKEADALIDDRPKRPANAAALIRKMNARIAAEVGK